MSPVKLLIIGLLISLFHCSTNQATARETINWIWYEQTPYFIGDGPTHGKGIGDKLTRLYQSNLPKFDHQNIRVNAARYKLIASTGNVCVPVAWNSALEREHFVHTRPHTLEPPAGIYYHRSKKHLFENSDDSLSLHTLLQNKQLKLGVISSLEYSKQADQLISSNRGQPNVLSIDAQLIQINLRLLTLNRLDYLMGLPAQKIEHIQSGGKDEFIFKHVQEINQYIPIYTHCSNTKTGRYIIEKLNNLLSDKRLIELLKEYEFWYPDDYKFTEYYMAHIIKGAANPLIQDP